MLKLILILTLSSITLICADQRGFCPPQHHGHHDNTQKVFKDAQIITDVIDNTKLAKLCVIFENNTHVNYGNQLTLTQVRPQPFVFWPVNCRAKDLYTLLFIDPDVPNRQDRSLGNIQHWTVVNIDGNKVETGDVLTEYLGSLPTAGSGLHRYTFLVFKQPRRIVFKEPLIALTNTNSRAKFSVRDFAAKYNLGKPIAGNYYQAQYDSAWEIITKELNIVIN